MSMAKKNSTPSGQSITINPQIMDAFPSVDCSSSVINHEEEEDDDWVVVKKQKIIILIPPPSPPAQQIVKQMSPKSVKICSNISQEKRPGHHKTGSDRFDRNLNLQQPQSSFHAYRAGNVGAVKVVNRQIRAMNLERKLQSLGGIRRWLSLLGLDRFAQVFERKRISQYELVDLSTSTLKDMGMNAVGPRRKLMHAIDLLCQPYYTAGASNHI